MSLALGSTPPLASWVTVYSSQPDSKGAFVVTFKNLYVAALLKLCSLIIAFAPI